MGSKYTDAQRRATDNYNKTLKNIGIRVKPEIYNKIKNAADAANLSIRAYLLQAVEEKINKDQHK